MTLFELFGSIVIKNSEANEIIDETADKAKNLGEELNNAGTNADTTSEKFGENSKIGVNAVWLGHTLDRIGTAAYNYVKKGLTAGYEYNKMMENYSASFSVMIGNEQKAKTLLDDLWTLAANTPLEMTGVAKNAEELLNYSITVENLIPTLELLGNASLGNQQKMDGLVRAYGQIVSYGTLKAQETNQMIENGFPILEMLADYKKTTVNDILSLREEGAISHEEVHAAFVHATSEGGRYYEAMLKYAETLAGKEAKLQDNTTQMLGNLMQPFTEEYKDTVFGKIMESVEKFNTFIVENQDLLSGWAETLGTLATGGLDALINVLEWMIRNKDAAVTAIEAIGIAAATAFAASHPYIATVAALGIPLIDFLADYIEAKNNLSTPEIQKAQEVTKEYAHSNPEKYIQSVDTSALWKYISGNDKGEETKIKLPDADATAEEIEAWLETVDPELKKELGIDPPDAGATKEEIESWWSGVQPKLVSYYSLSPDASSGGKTFITGSGEEHGGAGGGFKTGLDFVPRDNYLARLHKGEAILTANEAREWRNGRYQQPKEVYREETVITGNNFYIRDEQDIYDLAVEMNSLKRSARLGRGMA